MTAAVLIAALVAAPAGDLPRPEGCPTGLSGVTHVSNDLYYAVNDARSLLVELKVGIDAATGQPTNCAVGAFVSLEGGGKYVDLEGVAWDSARGLVWVSDELDASIRAFDPATGARRGEVPVPARQDAFRYNRSLESLAIGPGGMEMWTCNEEALDAADARRQRDGIRSPKPRPETTCSDGPRATREKGTRVRLMRFARASAAEAWRPAGEWAYETDPIGGLDFLGKSRSGVADVAVLSDGTLLALERELSIKSGKFMPSLRCRIYIVDVSGAEDVAGRASLADFSGPMAKKTLLWSGDTGFSNYEGLCEGPRLKDGARTLLLVSDADAGAAARVMTLVLRDEK